MGRLCSTQWGRLEIRTEFWSENLQKRNKVWTSVSWLKTGFSGGSDETSRSIKSGDFLKPADRLSASQYELCSMEFTVLLCNKVL
jgi:hypothetical protein